MRDQGPGPTNTLFDRPYRRSLSGKSPLSRCPRFAHPSQCNALSPRVLRASLPAADRHQDAPRPCAIKGWSWQSLFFSTSSLARHRPLAPQTAFSLRGARIFHTALVSHLHPPGVVGCPFLRSSEPYISPTVLLSSPSHRNAASRTTPRLQSIIRCMLTSCRAAFRPDRPRSDHTNSNERFWRCSRCPHHSPMWVLYR